MLTTHDAGDRNATTHGGGRTRTHKGRLEHVGPEQPSLLTVDDVAAMLRISTRTVRRMADSGQMPRPLRLSSCLRFRRAELDLWIADGCPRCDRRSGR
jgi:excisionase family DNA binding protein